MFSTKGRYALRVMIDLAQQHSEEFIPLKDIAERQDISKKYLEIIAKEMVKGGLIIGASGKHGGYKGGIPVQVPLGDHRQRRRSRDFHPDRGRRADRVTIWNTMALSVYLIVRADIEKVYLGVRQHEPEYYPVRVCEAYGVLPEVFPR